MRRENKEECVGPRRALPSLDPPRKGSTTMKTKRPAPLQDISIDELEYVHGGGFLDGFFNGVLGTMTGGALGGYGSPSPSGPPDANPDPPNGGSSGTDSNGNDGGGSDGGGGDGGGGDGGGGDGGGD
jgi:hypothetical protein